MSTHLGKQHHGYRGRVRSGCLVCRARKVKCDEQRPTCRNCIRLKRSCGYKPEKGRESTAVVQAAASRALSHESARTQSPQSGSGPYSYLVPSPRREEHAPPAPPPAAQSPTGGDDGRPRISLHSLHDPFHTPDSAIIAVTRQLVDALRRQHEGPSADDDSGREVESPSALIARDIKLTTTMDLLTVREFSLQPLLSFFVESVDCPTITPYDRVNWRHMKLEVAELATSDPAVASAAIALSALHKAQLYGLPLSKACALYRLSTGEFQRVVDDPSQDFDTTLLTAFILCLFALIHYETFSVLQEPSEKFVTGLAAWAQREWSRPQLSSRIVTWFRLLQCASIRGGGTGLISEHVYNLLPFCDLQTPNLHPINGHHTDPSTDLYQILSTPVFEFYLKLQLISGEIAQLTHYHRSRTTGEDQDDVSTQVAHIKSRLRALWDGRSPTQRQTPASLRAHLAPAIADPLIALLGLAAAAYHAEFVEMDRLLGDPVSEATESRDAMRDIRDIVDGDWNAFEPEPGPDGAGTDTDTSASATPRLRPGYVRPLFLYAIECGDAAANAWAVDRLHQIRDPICRSSFFAAFAHALADAQRRKERRVTSKYFCLRYFGVVPPFM